MTYAGFMFLAEHDLLEIYLRETEHAVDRWVIVEADRTFTGNPKPWHFDEQADRFARWASRIVRVKCTDDTSKLTKEQRDQFYRNCILRGLGDVRKDDTCIIGDLDEIPSAEAIAAFDGDSAWSLRMQQFYWFINCAALDTPWDRCVILPGSMIVKGLTPVDLRYREYPVIENAGWHFSSMGGADKLAYKLASFAHAGMSHHADEVAGIRDGTWVTREHCTPITVVPVDRRYPEFVRENVGLMKEWGLIYEPKYANPPLHPTH